MSTSKILPHPRYHTGNLYPIMDLGFAYHLLKSEIKLKEKKRHLLPHTPNTLYKKAIFHLSRLFYHALISKEGSMAKVAMTFDYKIH